MTTCLNAAAIAQPLPSEGQYTHLGPATCASSVCHGKIAPDKSANVWLNEYSIWSRQDFHSRAYSVLRNEESQAIAAKLGLPSAQTAEVCLECHADFVPAEKRGPKFQISDGVGCEACHGGAGKWIESHAAKDATHEENLALGMYPTEKPKARARLCLSCHVGTTDKFADHDIMAAGHPRMSFELVAFTVNQPAHYNVDEDYIARKGRIPTVNMWVTGALFTGKRRMELIQSERFDGHGVYPELALFDCHACHHPMDDSRWTRTPVTRTLPVGVPRVNDSSIQMVIAAASVIAPSEAQELIGRLSALHEASTESGNALVREAAELEAYLTELVPVLVGHEYTGDEMRALRLELLENAGNGHYRDFTSAEQAFFAVETLSIELKQYGELGSLLDEWFATVADESEFSPGDFATIARRFEARVQ